jgi:hypothetical protein
LERSFIISRFHDYQRAVFFYSNENRHCAAGPEYACFFLFFFTHSLFFAVASPVSKKKKGFAEPNNFNVSVCPEPEEGFLQVAFRNERGEHGTTKVALLADWRNFSVKYRVFEGFVRIYYFRPEEVAEMTKRSFSSKETTSTSDKDDNIRPLSDQEFEYAEKQSRIERFFSFFFPLFLFSSLCAHLNKYE